MTLDEFEPAGEGLKERKLTPCTVCGEGLLKDRALTFYRLRLDYMVADPAAIQRRAGLGMMMGAAEPLAAVMGPDEDLAVCLTREVDILVCFGCGSTPVEQLLEILADRRKAAGAGGA